jgi:hypothetical protein
VLVTTTRRTDSPLKYTLSPMLGTLPSTNCRRIVPAGCTSLLACQFR